MGNDLWRCPRCCRFMLHYLMIFYSWLLEGKQIPLIEKGCVLHNFFENEITKSECSTYFPIPSADWRSRTCCSCEIRVIGGVIKGGKKQTSRFCTSTFVKWGNITVQSAVPRRAEWYTTRPPDRHVCKNVSFVAYCPLSLVWSFLPRLLLENRQFRNIDFVVVRNLPLRVLLHAEYLLANLWTRGSIQQTCFISLNATTCHNPYTAFDNVPSIT